MNEITKNAKSENQMNEITKNMQNEIVKNEEKQLENARIEETKLIEPPFRVSARGLRFIRTMEGLSVKAYRCPAGKLTIGYGHTGDDVKEGQVMSPAMAAQLLVFDVNAIARRLNEALARVGVRRLSQGQFDALVSFAYNAGVGALLRSTLWRKLVAGASAEEVAVEFVRWVYATSSKGEKVKLPGLVERRRQEREIFLE